MDFFSKQLGPSYVPAFAARLVLAMAHGVRRAEGAEARTVLLGERFERLWTLAIGVVKWYASVLSAPDAQLVNETLQDFELGPITASLDLFRERLLPFARTAHQAQSDAQLAGAGVYFVAAVEQMEPETLSAALRASPLASLEARILQRLPPPEALKERYLRTLGGVPNTAAPRPAGSPRPARVDHFDRADFAPRPTRTQGAQQARALPASLPPSPPTPKLTAADVTRAYLHTLGWEGGEVNHLLAGPPGKKDA